MEGRDPFNCVERYQKFDSVCSHIDSLFDTFSYRNIFSQGLCPRHAPHISDRNVRIASQISDRSEHKSIYKNVKKHIIVFSVLTDLWAHIYAASGSLSPGIPPQRCSERERDRRLLGWEAGCKSPANASVKAVSNLWFGM